MEEGMDMYELEQRMRSRIKRRGVIWKKAVMKAKKRELMKNENNNNNNDNNRNDDIQMSESNIIQSDKNDENYWIIAETADENEPEISLITEIGRTPTAFKTRSISEEGCLESSESICPDSCRDEASPLIRIVPDSNSRNPSSSSRVFRGPRLPVKRKLAFDFDSGGSPSHSESLYHPKSSFRLPLSSCRRKRIEEKDLRGVEKEVVINRVSRRDGIMGICGSIGLFLPGHETGSGKRKEREMSVSIPSSKGKQEYRRKSDRAKLSSLHQTIVSPCFSFPLSRWRKKKRKNLIPNVSVPHQRQQHQFPCQSPPVKLITPDKGQERHLPQRSRRRVDRFGSFQHVGNWTCFSYPLSHQRKVNTAQFPTSKEINPERTEFKVQERYLPERSRKRVDRLGSFAQNSVIVSGFSYPLSHARKGNREAGQFSTGQSPKSKENNEDRIELKVQERYLPERRRRRVAWFFPKESRFCIDSPFVPTLPSSEEKSPGGSCKEDQIRCQKGRIKGRKKEETILDTEKTKELKWKEFFEGRKFENESGDTGKPRKAKMKALDIWKKKV